MADLPRPGSNADQDAYWEAAAEGRLLLQRCRRSGRVWHYPRAMSPETWEADDVEWIEAEGRGHVHAFSVVHRAPTPAFADRVPYVVALIDLAEGARLFCNVIGPGALETAVGEPVRIVFEARGEGSMLPQAVREGATT